MTDKIVEKLSSLSEDIEVKTTKSFVQEYNQFKIIENSSLVISSLAFLMGLMGIASIMSMIVNSRKEEFGIMRALGKSRGFIMKNLFFEALIMSISAYIFALIIQYWNVRDSTQYRKTSRLCKWFTIFSYSFLCFNLNRFYGFNRLFNPSMDSFKN